MQKIILLHSTNGSSLSNWSPWLSKELTDLGWNVCSPSLPDSDKPSAQKYIEYIDQHAPFDIDIDTIIAGHSSGTVAALQLLQPLPEVAVMKPLILVGSHRDDLGWSKLHDFYSPAGLQMLCGMN
jgi:predicted alpha/beta hydrolase family esterase